MPQFKSVPALIAYVKKNIDSALDSEVFDVVKETEVQSAKEVVYGAYSPKSYKRRGSRGGISSESNVSKVGGGAHDGKLIVENITPTNPYLNGVDASRGLSRSASGPVLAGIVEFGYGYDYWRGSFAREFIYETILRLQASGECKDALKSGLIARGIPVR